MHPRWQVALRASALAASLVVAACSAMSDVAGGIWGGDDSKSTAAPPAAGAPQATAAAGLTVQPPGGEDDAKPLDKIYNKAVDYMKDGRYAKAAKEFEEVERQHPYSAWATRATLMAAYANYQGNLYTEAVTAAQRFITLHPGHKDAAYAYYLIGLSHYEQITDVTRDQRTTDKALKALEEVSRRFPGTDYARDAESKAVLARDHLAGKEMQVGRYYLDRSAFVAAINRFKKVVTDYQTTSQTPEALYRLTECYYALGIRSEAQTAAAVLGHNFPNSRWYKDAFALLGKGGIQPVENKDSWISRTIRKVNPF